MSELPCHVPGAAARCRIVVETAEVRAGSFENYNDVKEGDVVEAFKMVEIPR